jgi:hypothetical protein
LLGEFGDCFHFLVIVDSLSGHKALVNHLDGLKLISTPICWTFIQINIAIWAFAKQPLLDPDVLSLTTPGISTRHGSDLLKGEPVMGCSVTLDSNLGVEDEVRQTRRHVKSFAGLGPRVVVILDQNLKRGGWQHSGRESPGGWTAWHWCQLAWVVSDGCVWFVGDALVWSERGKAQEEFGGKREA